RAAAPLTPGASPGLTRGPPVKAAPESPAPPHPSPAPAVVSGRPVPGPGGRSRELPLHGVEDAFRHVALGQERQLDGLAGLADDGDTIGGDFKPRAGLERVV